MVKTLSQSEFGAFKKKVSEGINRKNHSSVLLSEIELISPEMVKVRDISFFMDKTSFTSLVKCMGIPVQMVRNLELGGRQLAEFIGKLRFIMKEKKNDDGRVFMYVINDGGVFRVTKFTKGMSYGLDDNLFFEIVDRVANRGNFEVGFAEFDGSNAVINLVNNKSQVDFGGDESFVPSMNLIMSPYQHISAGSGNMRLVCSNGMITGVLSRINRTSKDEVKKFIVQLDSMSDMSMNAKNLQNGLFHAKKVNASFNELYKVTKIVSEGSCVEKDSVRVRLLNDFFKIYDVKLAYMQNDIDIFAKDKSYQKTAETPVNMWELINQMTWLSSHQSELELTTETKMKLASLAGEYMEKDKYDLENIAPRIF